jgi:hypothetical protein
VAGTQDPTEPAFAVKHRTEQEAEALRIETEVQRRTAIIQTEANDSYEKEGERRFTQQLARSQHIFPVPTRTRRGGEVALDFTVGTWTGKKLYLTVDIDNRSPTPAPLDDIRVFDRTGARKTARVVALFPNPAEGDDPPLLPRSTRPAPSSRSPTHRPPTSAARG